MTLYITYDTKHKPDGAGAQLNRILGIIAISQYYNITYYHTPIDKILYQGLSLLVENKYDDQLVTKWNDLLDITTTDIAFNTVISELNPSHNQLLHYINVHNNTTDNVLLKLAYPYGITESMTEIMDTFIPPKITFNNPFNNTDDIVISCHIRRGEIRLVAPNRLIPNEYYFNLLTKITQILDARQQSYQIHIYSEVPKETVTITQSHKGIMIPLKTDDTTISPETEDFSIFKTLKNTSIHLNRCPIQDIVCMMYSDIFIASFSSFSYIASLLNQNNGYIIVPKKYVHYKLKTWHTCDDRISI
jgi:hypothetical protein